MSGKVASRDATPSQTPEEDFPIIAAFLFREKYSEVGHPVDKGFFRIPGNEPIVSALIKINSS